MIARNCNPSLLQSSVFGANGGDAKQSLGDKEDL
jgi:hypothetical protein